ncbi:MBL fold metallo-hydrolase [Actinocorallia sp. API 0066]|uniref:MBL fold metallo-hydrolase n=1 Tax=Actinocorallia sp. API 0066 TaxID=2896846 RepID=UPI001E4950FC|nr:MBL fold metallo-hydrolase [Actinocorallia sp. API 0066]MCD0448207.1 MBL fold metallo-hydrolase [Actinocorallia sp. API 0066]
MPDHGGGVWSVPVPIPGNPLGRTLVYVLESPGGPVLIDAGWEHPESWRALKDGLSARGVGIEDVRGVVVTHMHPDHAGLAGRIRERSGAWIAMHSADAALVRLMRERADERLGDWLVRAGAAEAEGAEFSDTHRPDPPAVPDRELEDGDLVDLPGRRLRTVWTPGHSPGHICLHLEDRDVLFTGDHVLPEITPHVGLYPYDLPDVDPLGDYLRSLAMTADLGIEDAFPAHQYSFTGIPRRAKEIIEHHEERLTEILGLLTPEPQTLWTLTQRCQWSYPWATMPPISRHLATGETAAHLRVLEHRGEARLAPGPGPLRYARGLKPLS